MASDLQLNRVPVPPEEEEFHQILKQIGGKGNVYLVGDVDRKDDECKCSLMKEFVADVLAVDGMHGEMNKNGEIGSECCSGSKGQSPGKPEVGARMRATSDKGRAMHCAIVVFLFRHAYVRDKANHVSVREVLKDVRTRTEGHGVRPALLGLVHDHCESAETAESVELLEQMLRSVFCKHPHDSIWAGHFVPKAPDGVQAIRRHICRSVLSAQAAQSTDTSPGRNSHFFWPLRQCFRRGRRDRHDTASDDQVQKGSAESKEEEIPLQTRAEPCL
ncbi:uncharacterized protein LOC118819489 [Colossoma macropomum]|uniref:uncharacterized protein LOC118819489 n=1 Tax=Colossoma macropomum TaxID=42526 RepID=UPI001863F47F|nr:uncharacterized protein LOC118819489 [Colossoma macropomum]